VNEKIRWTFNSSADNPSLFAEHRVRTDAKGKNADRTNLAWENKNGKSG
jgi:hypothetical protein